MPKLPDSAAPGPWLPVWALIFEAASALRERRAAALPDIHVLQERGMKPEPLHEAGVRHEE